MAISTKQFNDQTVRLLGQMNDLAVGYQRQIATGKKDLAPSVAPVDSARLSAAEEIDARIQRYQSNINSAENRLNLADNVLSQVETLTTRAYELAIQGANDTYSAADRQAMRIEVDQITESLVSLANTKDTLGMSLFGGFQAQGASFTEGLDGRISYQGDLGQHRIKVSDTTELSTGIDGATAFMRVGTAEGPISVFEVLRGLSQALTTSNSLATSATLDTAGGARVTVSAGRSPMQQSFTLTGSQGAAHISAEIIDGSPGALIAAINAQTSITGITAIAEAGTGSFVLTDLAKGAIQLTNYQVSGQKTAQDPLRGALTLTPLDASGTAAGPAQTLADADQAITASVGLLSNVTNHISTQRAKIGAYANAAMVQHSNLEEQSVFVQKAKSEIADADLADLITRLQTLLLNRDATQQAFSKISQQSLFDYLR
ncbi:flagellar hook-associated protein FlgL [Cypionkella sp.]|jgi:flagellar hook-associated protein 3 FlgL|uniref:flagellar hook-associated protein FlgL n=1 Tax=Cypionkella sp. TaxID=2811411 RepID=UPI002FDC8FF7